MSDVAVYKNTTVEGLDAFFRSSGVLRSNYEYALELLRRNESLAAIIDQLEQDRRGPEYAYPTPPDSPLTDVENLDEVVRSAYILAIERAIERADRDDLVPLETLWETGQPEDGFEIHVVDGARAITVLWRIPIERSYGSTRATSRSWRIVAGAPPVQTSGWEGAEAAS